MKPNLNKYIEQSHPNTLYPCGTYRYKHGILPTITRTMRLPNDMHTSGLFIAGCDCSTRRYFTAHYVKQLLAGNTRVIFITDRLSTEHEQNDFCERIGIDRDTKEGIHFGDLSAELDVTPFENDSKIVVLSGGYNFESYCEYDPNLISLLGSIKAAKLGYKFGAPFVVVIEDDMGYRGSVERLLPDALNGVIGYDECVGFIVSTMSPMRYSAMQRSFKHFVVFGLCDATELTEYDVFRRSKLVKGIDGYLHREYVDTIDIKRLEHNHFHYTCSHIAEWVLNVKFSPKI